MTPNFFKMSVYDAIYATLILSVVILTRGIVSSMFHYFRVPLEETHHHVHYSNEFSTADLDIIPKPKPDLNLTNLTPKSPSARLLSSPISKKSKPKHPPRDELV